jgi:hypothetical protein
MKLLEIRIENHRKKTYKVNKLGILYIYGDRINDYHINSGETYIVESTGENNQIFLKKYTTRKTYQGVKLTKSKANVYLFKLKYFLDLIDVPYPCICDLEACTNEDKQGFIVTFLCKNN